MSRRETTHGALIMALGIAVAIQAHRQIKLSEQIKRLQDELAGERLLHDDCELDVSMLRHTLENQGPDQPHPIPATSVDGI